MLRFVVAGEAARAYRQWLLLHERERQSESSPQGAPGLQLGEQRDGPQVLVAAVQTNDEQFPLSEQAAPGPQCGEQAGG